eukprot:CAMPEP_0178921524 /NCGR_PEP_ID=MMETSP0786-20121207/15611_1 /TAXON_ID=186022 /ORGANISM="Thalassionema frauenfeldii, Strain CCMP 1798" /LENGTH=323 /DNA_ID=CAMNT_0020595717 /DNA_START=571 /DNA_END=1542 /DNA_ORIENTATION=+
MNVELANNAFPFQMQKSRSERSLFGVDDSKHISIDPKELTPLDYQDDRQMDYSSVRFFAESTLRTLKDSSGDGEPDSLIDLLYGHVKTTIEPTQREPHHSRKLQEEQSKSLTGNRSFPERSDQSDIQVSSFDEDFDAIVEYNDDELIEQENDFLDSSHDEEHGVILKDMEDDTFDSEQVQSNFFNSFDEEDYDAVVDDVIDTFDWTQPAHPNKSTNSGDLYGYEDTSIARDYDVNIEDTGNYDKTSRLSRRQDRRIPTKRGKQIEVFGSAMWESYKSQQLIHAWDRKMGLKRSHSKTMRHSMRSRKALRQLLKADTGSSLFKI